MPPKTSILFSAKDFGVSRARRRPWRIDMYRDKFVRYLRGGGLSALVRPESELEREEIQTRFLWIMLGVAALWFVGWIT